MFNPFCISYPSNLQVVCGLNSISGTGIPCAKICVNIDNYMTFNTTVNCDGIWNIPICNNLKEGICTIEAIQIYNCSSSCCIIKVTIQNPNSKPLILSPQINEIIDISQPEISGISSPNSPIIITIEKSLTTRIPIDNIPILEVYESIQVMSNDIGVYKAKITKPLVSGLYYLTVSQYPCNTSSTIHFIVKLPLSAPTIIYPSNGSTIEDSQPVIRGTANPYNTVTICVDNYGCILTTANSDGEFSYQFNVPFLNGEYTIVATQTDSPGNVSPEATSTFFINVYVPQPTINEPPNNSTIDDNQPIISGVAIPGNKVNICLSNYGCIETTVNELGVFSIQFPLELPDDTYTITATQIDTIGNVSDETNSVFTVNTVIPVPAPQITSPPNGDVISIRNPIIKGNGIEGYTVEICLSSSIDYGCITSNVNIHGLFEVQFADLLPEGNYAIHATQIDTEGRRSETISSTFTIEAILPVPEPTPLSPENNSTIADSQPYFTGVGTPGNTAKLCLTLPDTSVICQTTVVDDLGEYVLRFDNPLENGAYILNSTEVDAFGYESNPVTTNFTIDVEYMNVEAINAIMGPSFRTIDLIFNISGLNNSAILYYLLVPPNSEAPSISDIKNYPNNENLLNGTVARGQFNITITPEVVENKITVHGKDNIIPLPGEIGIVDGYNYDSYIYIEVSPSINSGVIGFGNIAMGMPFNGGDGSLNSPFGIVNLSEAELSNYPDLLATNPLNLSKVDENARMLQNIERLEVLYDETNGYYGMEFSLDLNYILNSNIDLSNYESAYNNEGWIPIGNYDASHYTEGPTGRHLFTGTFNGSNYTISNLSITPIFVPNIKWVEHLGLFGYTTNATISNLNLDNVNIAPSIDATDVEVLLNIGSLIGYSNNSLINGVNISNVVIDVSDNVINITSLYIAGMIGSAYNCIINGKSSSSTTSKITNISIESNDKLLDGNKVTTNVSAMISVFKSSEDFTASISNYLIDTLSKGNNLEYDLLIGGIVAYLENLGPMTISNIYISNFNITNNYIIGGGLIGSCLVSNTLEINDISVDNISINSTNTTLTTEYIGGVIGYLNCSENENNVSIHDISVTTFNLKGFVNVGGFVGYLLSSKISSSDLTLYNLILGTKDINTTSNLQTTSSYCGGIIAYLSRQSDTSLIYLHDINVYNTNILVKDYGGGLISNLYYTFTSSVFTFIERCNCNASIGSSYTTNFIGGLIGRSLNTAFNNCSFDGTISSTGACGGLVGSCSGFYINECNTNIILTGKNSIGGIAGNLSKGTIIPFEDEPFKIKNNIIELSYSIGNINTSSNFDYCGGLIGYIQNITVDQCFANVNITSLESSNNDSIGMLLGSFRGNSFVTNSYSIGNLSFNTNSQYIGGVVGYEEPVTSSISLCYSSSNVSGKDYIGGITGGNSSYVTVNRCFALNPEVSSVNNQLGRIVSFFPPGALSNNYAINTLKLFKNGVEVAPTPNINGIDGANTSLATLKNDMINAGWDSNIWNFDSIDTLGRPTLKNNPEPRP